MQDEEHVAHRWSSRSPCALSRESGAPGRRAARGLARTRHRPATTASAGNRRRDDRRGSGRARWRRLLPFRHASPRPRYTNARPTLRRVSSPFLNSRSIVVITVVYATGELRRAHRVLDVDLASIPHDRHHFAFERPEAVLENLVRRLETPEQKGRVIGQQRRLCPHKVSTVGGNRQARDHRASAVPLASARAPPRRRSTTPTGN